jgi:hypothetical protein
MTKTLDLAVDIQNFRAQIEELQARSERTAADVTLLRELQEHLTRLQRLDKL